MRDDGYGDAPTYALCGLVTLFLVPNGGLCGNEMIKAERR